MPGKLEELALHVSNLIPLLELFQVFSNVLSTCIYNALNLSSSN